MRLQVLSEVLSIRLQESSRINSDKSCKERTTEGFEIMYYQQGKKKQKNLQITEWEER